MHPVLQLLAGRAHGEKDEQTLALAIEGGGMAGAVSAGMCVELESRGLINHFDLIIGSSAGSLNGSYSACGQAKQGAANYLSSATPNFISFRNLLRKRPFMHMPYLFEHLIDNNPYLSEQLSTGFRCLSCSLDRQPGSQLVVLQDFKDQQQLRTAVQASCHLPVLCGSPPVIKGERMIDGGLLESIPYLSAIEMGATHVLVLRSYSKAHVKSAYGKISLAAVDKVCPQALQLVEDRPALYNLHSSRLQSEESSILQIAPRQDLCTSFERSSVKLSLAMKAGAEQAAQILQSQTNGSGGSDRLN